MCSLTMKHTRVVSLNVRQAKPGVHLIDTTQFSSVQFSDILDAGPCWTSVSRSLVGFPMGEKEHGIMGFPYAGRGAKHIC